MDKHPDFLIMGAMKCATSTLHEQLALQPGFFMSELKEPNFFSNDEQYARGMDWYLSLFQGAPEHSLCGESSTHYTKLPTYPNTIDRIGKHLPQVKLIYVMRHPIDRLVSQYVHEWSQGRVSTDIDRALDSYPQLIEYSRYSRQLQPYFETFGSQRILPVFFERLFAYPQSELERICQFLGYSGQPHWHENLDAQNVSSERVRRSAWRDAIVEMPLLRQIRQHLVPKKARDWVRGLWTLKQRPELAPENIDRLRVIFDEDLTVLGGWLGLELSCDNFKATVKANSSQWVNPPAPVISKR
ncbi:MAG: sulfotransferase [Geitlerinemataceae cyanobacterium]